MKTILKTYEVTYIYGVINPEIRTKTIETTMQYISTSSESIKNNYQKYVF